MNAEMTVACLRYYPGIYIDEPWKTISTAWIPDLSDALYGLDLLNAQQKN
jgi:hypothetical protein